MTQTPLQTHSLFDDLLDQQQTSSPAPNEVAAVDEAAQDATFDQATSNTAPPADEPSVHQAESTQTDYKSDALAVAEFIEFDGKFMHVTDPDLVISKVQRHKLSPSTASALLDNCPASWAFEKLLPFDDSPFSPAGAGGLAHEALESFYELPPKQRDGVALSEEISKVVHKTFPHDAAKSALLSQKLNHLAGGVFDLEDPMDIHVDRVEEKIEETIDGIPVTGTVDRTELIDGGDVWIGDYKGLALDTPIPTPNGWTTMGKLEVGDQVLGTLGGPTTVTIKSQVHHRDCYLIEFSDGSSVTCDHVHLWQITDLNALRGGEEVVVSTDELFKRFNAAAERGKYQSIVINNPQPVELPERNDLELDPYILGSWLGNGSSRGGEIHYGFDDAKEYHDAITKIWGENVSFNREATGVAMTLKKPNPRQCSIGMDHGEMTVSPSGYAHCQACEKYIENGQKASEVGMNIPLTTMLRRIGLLHNKHVPIKYLRGSIGQRLSLLQGLMDTGGHFNPQRNRCVFVSTTAALADAVSELVSSLGITVQRFRGENEHKGFYNVEFRPEGFNPFRLRRKAAGVEQMPKANGYVKCHRRFIKAITRVDSVPTQCIQVDAPNSLYLCGPQMVATHNTGKAREKKYRGNYERAMRVYTLLKEAQTGQRPAGASLLYTADKQEFDVSVTERDLDKTRRDLRKAWDLHNTCVEDSAFPTKTGPLCGWCPLANICIAAQDDGFGPSPKAIDAGIEFIPAPEDDEGQDISDAGHCEDSTENTSDDTEISTPQKETMTTRPLIEEPSPFAMLTDSGELNPPSGAATSLFGLYSRIDQAIRTSHPDFDRDRQRELTTLTLNDVVEVLVQSATAWIGTDASPQDGAFTRLTQVADTHIAREQCDFDDEDSVNSWLDDLASELGFAVGTVLDVFDAYLPAED